MLPHHSHVNVIMPDPRGGGGGHSPERFRPHRDSEDVDYSIKAAVTSYGQLKSKFAALQKARTGQSVWRARGVNKSHPRDVDRGDAPHAVPVPPRLGREGPAQRGGPLQGGHPPYWVAPPSVVAPVPSLRLGRPIPEGPPSGRPHTARRRPHQGRHSTSWPPVQHASLRWRRTTWRRRT